METNTYWEKRKHAIYYQVCRTLSERIGDEVKSVIDVGSAGSPVLEWFPHAIAKTSIDLRTPYQGPGVQSIATDFLKWKADRKYDLVICLQVLEHVRDAKSFAEKLLSAGKLVLVSVPYKWPHGHTRSHIHDPVDEIKMLDWFGRQPNYEYVCKEVTSGQERLIHVYDWLDRPWISINQRNRFKRESLALA